MSWFGFIKVLSMEEVSGESQKKDWQDSSCLPCTLSSFRGLCRPQFGLRQEMELCLPKTEFFSGDFKRMLLPSSESWYKTVHCNQVTVQSKKRNFRAHLADIIVSLICISLLTGDFVSPFLPLHVLVIFCLHVSVICEHACVGMWFHCNRRKHWR